MAAYSLAKLASMVRQSIQERPKLRRASSALSRCLAAGSVRVISIANDDIIITTLAVNSSGDEDRSHGDCIAKPDHARQKVGAIFRNPAPASSSEENALSVFRAILVLIVIPSILTTPDDVGKHKKPPRQKK